MWMVREMSKRMYRGAWLQTLAGIVLFVTGVVWTLIRFANMDLTISDNQIRLKLSPAVEEMEQGIFQESEYPALVFSREGNVIYRDGVFARQVKDVVNPNEYLQNGKSLQKLYPDSYQLHYVLMKDGEVSGFAVFLVPMKELEEKSGEKIWWVLTPVLAGSLTMAILLLLRTLHFTRKILRPLNEICLSTSEIIKGNYDREVVRTYAGKVRADEIGELTYSFELMRDELKEKQVREEALKKSQQELISCISHDLKTPLSTIKAYTEGLRDRIALSEEMQAEFVEIILRKTDLIIEMTQELLEYSNAQLNQMEMEEKEVYFADFFLPLMEEIKIYVNRNRTEFVYDKNVPNALLRIDVKRFTQVMYNLVENSLKYMGDEIRRLQVETEIQGEYLAVSITDSGPGVDSDDMAYVFERFYRAEKSRSSSIPGSGLGLSICKYIMEKQGGTISCQNSPQGGFCVILRIRLL